MPKHLFFKLTKQALPHPPLDDLEAIATIRRIALIYHLYRILIVLFLILANYVLNETLKLRIGHEVLASSFEYWILGGYLVFAFAAIVVYAIIKVRLREQMMVGLFVDMFALTLMLYSGVAKDLQIVPLYMIATAASFMMLRFRQAVAVAFVAILSLIFQQVYNKFSQTVGFLSLTDTILLSLSLLAVGFLSYSITLRITAYEARAKANEKEAKRLSAINEEVIKSMTSGIVVVDIDGYITLINKTAQALLRLPEILHRTGSSAYLLEAQRLIHQKYPKLTEWYQTQGESSSFHLQLPQKNTLPKSTVRIQKKPLNAYGLCLILEDLTREESHAERLKLASLGRLSASIAHEIRNPLGAIAQASELLIEIDESENQELYTMIFQQTKRVNRIIEDVMRLSRQELPAQENIDLKEWLYHFLEQNYAGKNIRAKFAQTYHILFDPNHLEQIFTNLLDNALRHTLPLSNLPDVFIWIHHRQNQVLIDVLDNGTGVSQEDIPRLFEPFFTKSLGGIGLGLYLSKSFSEANQGHLLYLEDSPKTCFRLIATML